MKAIIPVAGVGTRLRPHTFSQPKVLLNVAGKPIIGHIMDKLVESGIDEAIVIVGYLGEMIESYLKKNYDITFTFVNQEERLGLAHAIWMCHEYIHDNEPVFILLGDTIFDVDLTGVLNSPVSTLGVREVEDPRRFGIAITSNGQIVKLVEKPNEPVGNLAIVGLYFILHSKPLFTCIETLIRENIKTKGEFQLTDALQMMLENGEPLSTFPVNNWYDCGKPETLLSTNETLLKEHSSKSSIRGCIINEPAFISKSAQINNAIIGPNTSIGENVIIEDAIIENSIIGNFSKVQHVSLNKSIIGNNVDLSGDPHEANIGDFSEIKLR
ncbi:MAG: NTP transferase domain-containing protein [Chlorobium phaeobacteroides]|uniref:Nucleotidyl transferase n=1 Tax=Chlorobium phaeobacteroides (strain BS1) TaxID=331678 RepID=B3EKD2_CHLPB|nr:NTP transferase domain-containing protein [Chlorobium phaeobacteroides]NEX13923.1 nucleotidyl transferase [Prosthecochloris sp.]